MNVKKSEQRERRDNVHESVEKKKKKCEIPGIFDEDRDIAVEKRSRSILQGEHVKYRFQICRRKLFVQPRENTRLYATVLQNKLDGSKKRNINLMPESREERLKRKFSHQRYPR